MVRRSWDFFTLPHNDKKDKSCVSSQNYLDWTWTTFVRSPSLCQLPLSQVGALWGISGRTKKIINLWWVRVAHKFDVRWEQNYNEHYPLHISHDRTRRLLVGGKIVYNKQKTLVTLALNTFKMIDVISPQRYFETTKDVSKTWEFRKSACTHRISHPGSLLDHHYHLHPQHWKRLLKRQWVAGVIVIMPQDFAPPLACFQLVLPTVFIQKEVLISGRIDRIFPVLTCIHRPSRCSVVGQAASFGVVCPLCCSSWRLDWSLNGMSRKRANKRLEEKKDHRSPDHRNSIIFMSSPTNQRGLAAWLARIRDENWKWIPSKGYNKQICQWRSYIRRLLETDTWHLVFWPKTNEEQNASRNMRSFKPEGVRWLDEEEIWMNLDLVFSSPRDLPILSTICRSICLLLGYHGRIYRSLLLAPGFHWRTCTWSESSCI